jgi:hypothetical protein
MRAEGILGHELLCYLPREIGLDSALDVDLSQLLLFKADVPAELFALAIKVGLFSIRLRAD